MTSAASALLRSSAGEPSNKLSLWKCEYVLDHMEDIQADTCVHSMAFSSYFNRGDSDLGEPYLGIFANRLLPDGLFDSLFVAAATSFEPDVSPSRDLAPGL